MAFKLFLLTGCILFSKVDPLLSAGKPDVTRHEANFLESAVNLHIEQSPHPVVLVKISEIYRRR
jgi:hypothetical protein